MDTARNPKPSMPENELREIFLADVAVLRQRAAREAASVYVPSAVRHSRDLKRAEMNRSTNTNENRATKKAAHNRDFCPEVATDEGRKYHDPTTPSRLRTNEGREEKISHAS